MLNLLGQYLPAASFWHTVDPRSKMTVVMTLLLPLLGISRLGWVIWSCSVAGLYLSARIPLKMGWRVVARFKWLLMVVCLANLVSTGFTNPWVQLAGSLFAGGKLATSLVAAAWLGFVTKPQSLVEGLTRWLGPLAGLGVNPAELALFIGLVVRFVPELGEQAQQIAAAQRLRGAQPGKAWRREQQWIKSTLIPIFSATLRSSNAVALAMEARGYRYGQTRTLWEELRFRTRDWLITGLALLCSVGWIASRWF